MQGLDDLRLSLRPSADGGIVDAGIVKSAVSRIEAEGSFADLMASLSSHMPMPEEELERLVTRFVEDCILAGISPSSLAETMIVSAALLRVTNGDRKEAATMLRAVAAGIDADGAQD